MEAIVLAGGLGTRLKTVVSDVPKPMAPVAGKPFLTYLLNWLYQNGTDHVILSVGYKWKSIYNYLGYEYRSMKLTYSKEESPLGTGGAIALAMENLKEDEVFIVNGDTLFLIELKNLINFHHTQKNDISIALKPMKNFDRYGTVELDNMNYIKIFKEKQATDNGLINGGIYLLNRSIIKLLPSKEVFSFEKDFVEKIVNKISIGGFISDKYFIDVGIPEDYNRAQTELLIH